MQSEVVAK